MSKRVDRFVRFPSESLQTIRPESNLIAGCVRWRTNASLAWNVVMELTGKVQGPFFLCRLKLFDAGLMDMSSWAGRVNVVWRNNPLDKMGVYKRRVAVSRVIFQKCQKSCVSCRKNNETSLTSAEVGLCAARRDPAKSVGTGGSLDVESPPLRPPKTTYDTPWYAVLYVYFSV